MPNEIALTEVSIPIERLKLLIRCELESISGDAGHAFTVLIYDWRSLSNDSQKSLLHRREKYEAIWQEELKNASDILTNDIDLFVLRRFLQGAMYWTTHWHKQSGSVTLDDLSEMALKMILK